MDEVFSNILASNFIIEEEWKKNSKINFTDLGGESLKIPELHSKYYNYYLKYLKAKRKYTKELKSLLAIKRRYYLGLMDKKELDERGWLPCQLKISNTTIQNYLDSDNELGDITSKVEEIEDFCDFLKSVLTTINNRGFHIKNCIDVEKMKNGIN